MTEDRKQFNTIADSPLLSPDMIQRFRTAGSHIEQLQKATACEGTGPWVMAADGKITRARIPNDVFVGNKQWPVGDEQALYSMWLSYCQEVLELREEFVSDSGDLGEGKVLRGSLVGKWRVR